MVLHNIIRLCVGVDYADEQNKPTIRRGRFIAPIADVSALVGAIVWR